MGILVDRNTRVIVQGITGRQGSFHTRLMLEYGTRIVAGVTPGKAGMEVYGVPVYDSVEEALNEHPEANASIVFVPARFAPDAIYEAVDAGIKLVVVITEGIPVHDVVRVIRYARLHGSRIVGPNCPGIITPGQAKLGIMPASAYRPGRVGIVSRSGTLTYEIAYALTVRGIGQSTVIGIGGDPVVGTTMMEAVELFEKDPSTDLIVIIGEIGGDAEERVAAMVEEGKVSKPVVAYVAGKTAPPGKRMGHAGAIISMGTGSAKEKIERLMDAGIPVAETPGKVADLVSRILVEGG